MSYEVAESNPLDKVYKELEISRYGFEKLRDMIMKVQMDHSELMDKMIKVEHDNRYLRVKIDMLEHQIRMIESDCDAKHSPQFTSHLFEEKEAKKKGRLSGLLKL